MKSLRFDRRIGYMLAAFAFLVAAVSPGLLTATVSADQILTRSIQLSSSAVGVTANTSYAVEFDPIVASGAVLIDFCTTALVGTACAPPTGMVTTGVTDTDGTTTVSAPSANSVKILKSFGTGVINLDLLTIKNPTVTGTFYARIITYTDNTALGSNTSATPGTYLDDGAVALSITETIGVSAAVLESLTFCVSGSGSPIGANCSTNVTAPTLELGEGTPKALATNAISTGAVKTQISTNAATGAVIRMKSSATSCGGLLRSGGGGACNITASANGILAGEAEFGVMLDTPYATSGVTEETGLLQAVDASGYSDSAYFMGANVDNSTGVTSPYGDDFLDTNDEPINNQNMDLTFGASVSPNTPAGLYTADISLIATGKF